MKELSHICAQFVVTVFLDKIDLGKDYYIDGQNTQLIFFENISTGGGKKAPQITPRGWIFWTMIFYDLTNSHQDLLMRGQTLF